MKHLIIIFLLFSAPQRLCASPPNVLFLAVDDMRTWVGCMGEDYPGKIHTPHIDALASQGRLFTNAHVPAPMCGPCRASLLTGQLPSRLGIYSNHQWDNLANDEAQSSVKKRLAAHATTDWAHPIPRKGAFHFDPKTYTFLPL